MDKQCFMCDRSFISGEQHYYINGKLCCCYCWETQGCDVCGDHRNGLLEHPDKTTMIAVCRSCHTLATETMNERRNK